jgi:3-acetyloctanal synthase
MTGADPDQLAGATQDVLPDMTSDMIQAGPLRCLLLIDQEEEIEDSSLFDRRLLQAVATMHPIVRAELSIYHCRVYRRSTPASLHYARPYSQRHCPTETGALVADMIAAVADLVEARVVQSVGSGRLSAAAKPTALGTALFDFLTARAGSRWGLHSYTGSVVSTIISDLEERAIAEGNPILRSPSEHGLACAAMGRWILDEAPYLIIVTSGMVDEFKGTLTNLRLARAKGFLICADTSGGYWYPFQGTIHQEEDSLAVLRSRGFETFYLDRPERLSADLARAFEAYDKGCGPVILVATPSVLESVEPLDSTLQRAEPRPSRIELQENAADLVLQILNREPVRLLWQCGSLSGPEADLVHDLAQRCGAALCDSLTRPGSVSKYRNGAPVSEFLGSLGLYATSARVHDYLHAAGKPLAGDELCMFFLKSRVAQMATPFTERILEKRMRLVQVTNESKHLAPFVDHPICSDLMPFLQYVSERLAVAPSVIEYRRRALRETLSVPADTVSTFPTLPMSPNYFFARLNELLEHLIEDRGYTYTGVFDAGRGALSAIRNLARTGPGFSGIYGRSLMGDALMAVPAIALSADRNVLVFVGDGAAALVPDIVPSFIQQVYLERAPFNRNVSIFRLCNGGHSLIRTYRETRRGAPADMQTTLINRIPEDSSESFGSRLTVNHRRLWMFDSSALSQQILQPRTLNLYSVLMDHNNDGDGIGAHSANSWQSARLS